MEKTGLQLWNQMEHFSPLVILGNKPCISPRSMVREGGGGVGGSRDCQGMWPEVSHFSICLKANQNFLISQICKPKWTVSGEISILKAKSSLTPF